MDLPPNSETTEELVSQTFALRNCRESTVLDLFCVQFERVFGEPETLLNEGSQLANAASLLAKYFLGVSGADDDLARRYGHGRGRASGIKYLGACVRDTDIAARVAFLGKFTGKEFVEFGAEDTVCDKLALFTDLS